MAAVHKARLNGSEPARSVPTGLEAATGRPLAQTSPRGGAGRGRNVALRLAVSFDTDALSRLPGLVGLLRLDRTHGGGTNFEPDRGEWVEACRRTCRRSPRGYSALPAPAPGGSALPPMRSLPRHALAGPSAPHGGPTAAIFFRGSSRSLQTETSGSGAAPTAPHIAEPQHKGRATPSTKQESTVNGAQTGCSKTQEVAGQTSTDGPPMTVGGGCGPSRSAAVRTVGLRR